MTASTALTQIDGKPLPTRPLQIESLPHPERDRHRAEVGVTVEAMLVSWYQPAMSTQAATAVLVDWMDELQGWTPKLIREAFVAYRDAQPDRRPNPAHIKDILQDRWGRRVVAEAEVRGLLARPEPAPPKERVTPDTAAQIMAAAGFAPRKIEAAE